MKKLKGFYTPTEHVFADEDLTRMMENDVKTLLQLPYVQDKLTELINSKVRELAKEGKIALFNSVIELPEEARIQIYHAKKTVWSTPEYRQDFDTMLLDKVNSQLIETIKTYFPDVIIANGYVYLQEKGDEELSQIKDLVENTSNKLNALSSDLKGELKGKDVTYVQEQVTLQTRKVMGDLGFSLREELSWDSYTPNDRYKMFYFLKRLAPDSKVKLGIEAYITKNEKNIVEDVDILVVSVYKVDGLDEILLWTPEKGWVDYIGQRLGSSSHTKLNEKGDHLFNSFLFVLQKQIHDNICNYDLGGAIADYLNKNYSFEIDNQQGIVAFDEEGDFFIVNPSREILYEFDLDLGNCYEVIGNFVKSLNFILILTSFLSEKEIDFNKTNDIDLKELVEDFCSWVKNQEELTQEIQRGIIEEFSHALLNELTIEDE